MLEALPDETLERVRETISKVIRVGLVPEAWGIGIITPIFWKELQQSDRIVEELCYSELKGKCLQG